MIRSEFSHRRAPLGARIRPAATIAVAILLLAFGVDASIATPQTEQREIRRSFPARGGAHVDLENLAGEIVIEGAAGSEIEIVATVNAASGGGADADTLLGLIDVAFDADGGNVDVEVRYPVDRFDTYRYPQRGRGNYNSQTRYQGERVTVTSRNDRDAVTLYVDFEIRLPAGVSIDVENVAGDITATDVEGDVAGDTGSGAIIVSGGEGEVHGDTGSGDVRVSNRDGAVSADTGSGDVEVTGVNGEVVADTGSGDVVFRDVQARRVEADTGSGSVRLERVTASISADTGSGDIIGESLGVGATITADTGSGDVRLAGDMSQVERIEVDTSSGDVTLEMTAFPGMRILVETGNGRIDVDLPDLQITRSGRNYFRGQVGDGSADVIIDTGSGSVRITAR